MTTLDVLLEAFAQFVSSAAIPAAALTTVAWLALRPRGGESS